MNRLSLEKLEWPLLCQLLEKECMSVDTKQRASDLMPHLNKDGVEMSWQDIVEIKLLLEKGYQIPLSELEPVDSLMKTLSIGGKLDGSELRLVFNLLESVKFVRKFASDFSANSRALKRFHSQTYSLPEIMKAIDKTIGDDFEVKDTASKDLEKLRRSKRSIRDRIEEKIQKLLVKKDMYIQDDFFSIRNDRYTIPMKLDGHGRVKGTVQDTSDSGHTLFIEPEEIKVLNDDLIGCVLQEKLELIRILKAISDLVRSETEVINRNYKEVIGLDFINAKAKLAIGMDAVRPQLVHDGVSTLIHAWHPLLEKESVVKNTIRFGGSCLIISGPNAGGKTVVLKIVGLLSLMAKAGLLLPVDPDSKVDLYNNVYVNLGDSQNITTNLSTFSGHIHSLIPVLKNASTRDLVLIDEICAGTAPEVGAAIAQSIMEQLVENNASTIVTTHFDSLKALATSGSKFKNASMEFADFQPTYKLIEGIPGQSYGVEVAERLGLPQKTVMRAKKLLGSTTERSESLLSDLKSARAQLLKDKREIENMRLLLEQGEHRFEQGKELLAKKREQIREEFAQKYDLEKKRLHQKYEKVISQLKEKLSSEPIKKSDYAKIRHDSLLTLKEESIESTHSESLDVVSVGDQVYVMSLENKGIVKETSQNGKIVVQLGVLTAETKIEDLRKP